MDLLNSKLAEGSCLFLDMDGVLANFYPYFRKYFRNRLIIKGVNPNEVTISTYIKYKKIKEIVHELCEEEGVDFWINMPKTNNCTYYWNHLKPIRDRIIILTGIYPEMTSAVEGKSIWIKNNLGLPDNRIIFNPDKAKYATYDGHINLLLDDSIENVDSFSRAGGIGLWESGKRIIAEHNVYGRILPFFEKVL